MSDSGKDDNAVHIRTDSAGNPIKIESVAEADVRHTRLGAVEDPKPKFVKNLTHMVSPSHIDEDDKATEIKLEDLNKALQDQKSKNAQ